MRPDEICSRGLPPKASPTRALTPAIVPSSVWICNDTAEAEGLLQGTTAGYVYQRDGHPNADDFAQKCNLLHQADETVVASSGMAALATAVLAICQSGDHIVVSRQLYGGSLRLLTEELPRLGITHSFCNPTDVGEFESIVQPNTKMVCLETIANPLLDVADVSAWASAAHRHGAILLVDNTLATPLLCRPLALGADWVLESVSKMMNGHSDVMLGTLSGRREHWDRVRSTLSVWGWASSPLDCWLALRGLTTLPLRVEQVCRTALEVATALAEHPAVERVHYPGLSSHPQHALAGQQFGGRFGWMITIQLAGGRDAADRFIRAAKRVPFCPSLGEAETTISHPESTSHRGMTPQEREKLGIGGGTLRLSVGLERAETVMEALGDGFSALA